MFTIQNYTLVSGARHVTLVCEHERKTKWLSILVMRDKALSVERVTASEREHMLPLLHKGKPYPLKRALKIFKRFAKSHGVTKGAKKFLREAS